MPRYANGQAPLSALVKLGDQHYLPAGTAARWKELQRLAWEKYGVWLVISPGWNAFRPLSIQYEYRAELGVWAAVPGYSSHGLTYNGRDCAAIDVYNWAELGWARFAALCRIVGFTVNFVSPEELWHIGDFDPWTVPAFADIQINLNTTATIPESEEDDMRIIFSQHLQREYLIGPGFITHLIPDASGALNAVGIRGNRNTNQLGKDDFRKVVEAHGLDYESARNIEPGQCLLVDKTVVAAGKNPWGPQWA